MSKTLKMSEENRRAVAQEMINLRGRGEYITDPFITVYNRAAQNVLSTDEQKRLHQLKDASVTVMAQLAKSDLFKSDVDAWKKSRGKSAVKRLTTAMKTELAEVAPPKSTPSKPEAQTEEIVVTDVSQLSFHEWLRYVPVRLLHELFQEYATRIRVRGTSTESFENIFNDCQFAKLEERYRRPLKEIAEIPASVNSLIAHYIEIEHWRNVGSASLGLAELRETLTQPLSMSDWVSNLTKEEMRMIFDTMPVVLAEQKKLDEVALFNESQRRLTLSSHRLVTSAEEIPIEFRGAMRACATTAAMPEILALRSRLLPESLDIPAETTKRPKVVFRDIDSYLDDIPEDIATEVSKAISLRLFFREHVL